MTRKFVPKSIRSQPGSLLWGSHRDELELAQAIEEELTEEEPVSQTTLDPLLADHTHKVTHPARRTFILQDVVYDSFSGLTWFRNHPLVESAAFSSRNALSFLSGKQNIRTPQVIRESVVFPIRPEPYYHWLIETVPRLLRAITLKPETEIVAFGSLHRYQMETLQVLGKDISLTLEPWMRPKLSTVCPTASPHSGWPHPTDVQFLRRHFLDLPENTSTPSPQLLYVSRRGQTRAAVNEDRLREELAALGFFHFVPEEFSFLEQVKVFSNVRAVVSSHGGALANTVFQGQGSGVLEVMWSNYANPCFKVLAQERGLLHVTLTQSWPSLDVRRIKSAVEALLLTLAAPGN